MDSRWLILAGLFYGRMCMGLQLQAVAALAEPLRADLGLSYAEIGTLVGLFLLPGVAVSLPGALIGRWLGERRVAVATVVLMALGSGAMALAGSFEGLAAARLLAGVGGILLNIHFARMVAELFSSGRLNFALSLLMASWPLGLALAAVLFPFTGESLGWRATFWGLSAVTAAGALLLAAVFALGPRKTERTPTEPEPRTSLIRQLGIALSARELKLALLAGFAWANFTAGGIIYLSFAPSFLIEGGLGATAAGGIVSLIVWAGLITIPLGGWLSDRFGLADLMILLGTAGTALLMLLFPLGALPLLLSLLIGLAWGLPPGPYMALLQRAVPLEARAGSYAVYFTLFYGGVALLPALAGSLRDLAAAAPAPLYFAAAAMATALPALWLFRRVART